MRETMAELMNRLAAGVQGPHWIRTSVGNVNLRNKRAAEIAARKLVEKRRKEANG